MLNAYLRLGRSDWNDLLLKTLVSLVLLGTLGPVTITVQSNLPITLQTLVILLVAICFGWKVGGLSVALYIAAGLAGAPVFANYTGGIGHLNGIFGGFFFGFVAAALIAGILAEHPLARKPLVGLTIWLAGHGIILALGWFWLRHFNPENSTAMISAALPGAAIKSAVGLLLSQILLRLVMKREEFYTRR